MAVRCPALKKKVQVIMGASSLLLTKAKAVPSGSRAGGFPSGLSIFHYRVNSEYREAVPVIHSAAEILRIQFSLKVCNALNALRFNDHSIQIRTTEQFPLRHIRNDPHLHRTTELLGNHSIFGTSVLFGETHIYFRTPTSLPVTII
jgi:hypothetical protein